MKKILYFVSGHGFGHAIRSALVVRELFKLGIRSEIVSSIPKEIFDSKLKSIDYGYHRGLTDVGVVQSDAITSDIPATYTNWMKLLDEQTEWIANYFAFCEYIKPSAIVCDIVPFAIPLARKAALPSILVTSFTWDEILKFYSDDDSRFEKLSADLKKIYSDVTTQISTPLSFGLSERGETLQVPLIGSRAELGENEIRKNLMLDDRPAFLVSFGGLGLESIGRLRLEEMDEYQFLFLSDRTERKGNIFTFDNSQVAHEELVKVSRAVITKPGYGISAECILNKTGMIYTSRGKFAEYEPLVNELKDYIPMKFISNEDLFSGALRPLLCEEMEFTSDLQADSGKGAEQAAAIIAGKAAKYSGTL